MNTGSSINLKLNSNLSLLFNQFNDLSSDSINKNPENMANCRYYDIDDIEKIITKPIFLSLFHLNTCSLNKYFNGLEYFIKTANQTFMILL